MLTLSLAMAFSGFTVLSLSVPRHHRDMIGGTPAQATTTALRGVGYALLGLALWPCLTAFGTSVGLILWLGLLSAAALLLVGLLAWRPRLTLQIGLGAMLAPVICLILSESVR
ncbi:MAG: DUF3325 domain-containing protein [Sphingobium sp.]|uniref:DUF3325 domain-containing protein n=1 Tax=Sphingobium sp. TaxID=1912891 RepID=UPI0029A7B203|nr:DUF3325 domain-containing protein [Sphingobium sp.]MDX3911620.1 DUF3325 domain-containing protein [Sphingobium sp.]